MVGYPDEGRILRATKKGIEWLDSPKKDIIIKLKRPKQSKTPFVAAGIVGFLLLIALTSAKPIVMPGIQTTTEFYIDHEPRTFSDSVNTTEFYRETERFTGGVPCTYKPYEFESRFGYTFEIINNSVYLRCVVNIKNLEQKVGEWKYYFVLTKPDGRWFESSIIARNVSANSSEDLVWMYQLDSLNNYDCKPKAEALPSLWKCNADVVSLADKERVVEKKRDITVIVDVQKSRNVTKDVNQTVYVNRLFGYSQPFWLGY